MVNEGSDYEPIKQSYTIRNLRREVENLKEQLRDAHEAGSHPVFEEGQKTAIPGLSPRLVEPKRRRSPATTPSVITHDRTHIVKFFAD